ncbi:hypothetical protein ACFOQM_17935 [Paenibacillus sp. GCM10012307]|uniref:Uncharacterized protein n=1 Tax=Paenibacillus roseus TaxID=2798579 RepID=A0A934J1K3_9BACL|nr:hypothetical protein [Paenibacillus roseus]MBJ6363106.1 hypothetical protein [Paenibacillus roseus]
METLLEFIIKNPFLAIILLGFLISFFGKKNKKAAMPPFGGGGQGQQPRRQAEPHTHETHADPDQWDRQDERDWTQEKPVLYPPAQPGPTALDQHAQTAASRREEQRARSSRKAAESLHKQSSSSTRSANQLAKPGAGLPQEEEMRRAIVWAEILGPPRAKRRHR